MDVYVLNDWVGRAKALQQVIPGWPKFSDSPRSDATCRLLYQQGQYTLGVPMNLKIGDNVYALSQWIEDSENHYKLWKTATINDEQYGYLGWWRWWNHTGLNLICFGFGGCLCPLEDWHVKMYGTKSKSFKAHQLGEAMLYADQFLERVDKLAMFL